MSLWMSVLVMGSALLGLVVSLAVGAWVVAARRSPVWTPPPALLIQPEEPVSAAVASEGEAAAVPALVEMAALQASLEASAQQREVAKAAAAAGYDEWLVKLGADYKVWQAADLEALQTWVAVVLRYAQTGQDGLFPVKPTWKAVKAEFGAAAPDKRFTSYQFFRRLNEALIEVGLITRGRPGIAARLNVDKLPGWVSQDDM